MELTFSVAFFFPLTLLPSSREKMRWMHADVEKVIVEWAYGRVLARPSNVLAPKDREL